MQETQGWVARNAFGGERRMCEGALMAMESSMHPYRITPQQWLFYEWLNMHDDSKLAEEYLIVMKWRANAYHN